MDTPAPLPRLRTDLTFVPVTENGQSLYIIEDPVQNTYYRIGEEEYLFISNLNRFSSLEPLLEHITPLSASPLDKEQAQTILQWLTGRQLLQQKDATILAADMEQKQNFQKRTNLNRLNLISIKIPCFNPDRLLRHCKPLFWLTGKIFFTLWICAGVMAAWVLFTRWSEFSAQTQGILGMDNLLWVWCIWFGLKIIHEFFHSLVCYRYGGRVYEAGILFILFIPLTYVNATSSWKFASKWQRIHVAVAGMFIEIGIAFTAVLVWAGTPDSTTGMIAHNTVIIAGISSLLFNANPLMRFDGYYILSDLLSIPNLYQRGMHSANSRLKKFFLGISSPIKEPLFVKGYGIAVFIWRVLVLFSLGYLASQLAGGLGIFITLGALVAWVGMPLFFFIKRWPNYREQNQHIGLHLLRRSTFCLLVAVAALYLIGWKKHIEAPGIIEYREQYSVKAVSPGFITAIRIKDGEKVKKGQLLLRQENKELEHMHAQSRFLLKQLELKMRLAHSTGKIAELQSLKEKYQSQQEVFQKNDDDLRALSVHAPGEGMVISRQLKDKIGMFIPKGEELLWIVTPQQKQLSALASQDDIDIFRSLVGKKVTINMRAAGIGVFKATLTQVDPTGTTRLAYPALGAMHGGPLDVRQSVGKSKKDQFDYGYSYELFTPRFTLGVALPPDIKQKVMAGQQAILSVQGNRISLAERLLQWASNWQKAKDKLM
ncbi:efflux RND transporter periplasmic adaptor subunit [Desulfogranum marinum]|uniref:efflux RND transporter periplasmic adaptor subunit n=1 Tax=Desulfogranum marinum TaxID=453220 RepID=UPI0029C91123|nr:efflux RND transporter periplasmic adaptor subunit [Desulfogranum marinum]